jgi:hypothetical protein
VTAVRLQEENLFARFVAMSIGSTNGQPIRTVTNWKYPKQTVVTALILAQLGACSGCPLLA